MTEPDDIRDSTGRTVFTGSEPHPYRTNTRFRKVDGAWLPIPDQRSAATRRVERSFEDRLHARSAARSRAIEEKSAMAKISRGIARRQAIGDPSIRQSEAEAFPLLETLRRDGNDEAIKLVKRYRRLVALCEAEPLKGLDYTKSDGGEVVRVSTRLTPEADIDAAAATDWKVIADGEIKYSSKVKKSKGAHAAPSRRTVVAANDNAVQGSVIKTESLHIKVTDEVLNAQIDAKPILSELRGYLGPLVDPFEDAVLGGRTLTAIGQGTGAKVKPEVAGKALVGTAIMTLSVKWAQIDMRTAREEREALRRFKTRHAVNDNGEASRAA